MDAIICHDGEAHSKQLVPQQNRSFEDFDRIMETMKKKKACQKIPMTLEGCVVRMADTISYIGRDIEDAIRLDMIARSDLPKEAVAVLGDTNGTIVFNLVTDVIQNSYQNAHITFSARVSDALKRLKDFNIERIYMNPGIKHHLNTIHDLFEMLFNRYLEDIEKESRTSVIFSGFLSDMSQDYIEKFSKE